MARPISDRNRRWLNRELTEWVSAGLLDSGQSQRILGHYETPADLADRKRWLVSVVLAAVAAVLVGMGVLLLVGHNWDLTVRTWEMLPRLGKIVVILAVLIASHAAAWHLRARTRWRMASELMFLFAGLMYGAGIWMVAQVFHVNAHYPDGLWWWALGVLPLALCLDSLATHVLFAGLLAVWVGCETLGFPNSRMLWGLSPNGAFSLLPLAGLGLAWCYRKGSAWGVQLYVALITWWLIVFAISLGHVLWGREEAAIFFLAMTGPLLLILGENHRPGNPMARPYYVAGALLTAVAVAVLSFSDFHHQFQYAYHYGYGYLLFGTPMAAVSVVVLLLMLIVVGASLTLLRAPSTQQRAAGPLARLRDVAWRQAVPMGIALCAAGMAFWDTVTMGQHPAVPAIADNVAMVALALWLMRVGVREEQGFVFAGGVCYLLLWSVMRYMDLFSDAGGMVGGALMFFACAAMLLILARIWRNRKELFSLAQESEAPTVPSHTE